MNAPTLLRAENLSLVFTGRGHGLFGASRHSVRAVDDVSFTLARNETLALVGESGSGKSTTGKLALGLISPTAGSVHYEGRNLADLRGLAWRRSRRAMQMIFQDSSAALDPRMTIGTQIEEVVSVHGLAADRLSRRRLAREILNSVGLGTGSMAMRYPRELSGGQRQRAAIARALAVRPALIVCDEPVSALDVSVQAQIVNLLMDAQERHGLSYLFISHDLRVVRHISHRVAVMYRGRIVETAAVDDIFDGPLHPYTRTLLAAVPAVDVRSRPEPRTAIVDRGENPAAAAASPGCSFRHRCPVALDLCGHVEPRLVDAGPGRRVACHLAGGAERDQP